MLPKTFNLVKQIKKFYKITNHQEIHHGFPFENGLNTLRDDFNPEQTWGKGGFHFTTKKNLPYWYGLGVHIREVELPLDDLDLRVAYFHHFDEFRSNRIILGKKYHLSDLATYQELDIKPDLVYLARNGFLDAVKIVAEKSLVSDLYVAAYFARKDGFYDVAEYLFNLWRNRRKNQ